MFYIVFSLMSIGALAIAGPEDVSGWRLEAKVRDQVEFHLKEINKESAQSYAFLTDDLESYLKRPSVFHVQSEDAHTRPEYIQKYQKGALVFVSFLLKFYATEEIYFLARDAEFFYDLARLIDPERKSLHLINISRESIKSKNLVAYLRQHEFFHHIQSGQRVIFVDTGFFGHISRAVMDLISPLKRHLLKTHLVASESPSHPSSLAFLTQASFELKRAIFPSALHLSVENFEFEIPHYTDRAFDYVLDAESEWLHPVSYKNEMSDGKVSKILHLLLMQDFKYLLQQPETQAFVKQIMNFVGRVKYAWFNSDGDELKKLLYEDSILGSKLYKFLHFSFDSIVLKESLMLDAFFALDNLEKTTDLIPEDVVSPNSRFLSWLSFLGSDENVFDSGFQYNEVKERVLEWVKAENEMDVLSSIKFHALAQNQFLMNAVGEVLFTQPESVFIKKMKPLFIEYAGSDHLIHLIVNVLSKLEDLGGEEVLLNIIKASEGKANGFVVLNFLLTEVFAKPAAVNYDKAFMAIYRQALLSKKAELLFALAQIFPMHLKNPQYAALFDEYLRFLLLSKKDFVLEHLFQHFFAKSQDALRFSGFLHQVMDVNNPALNAHLMRALKGVKGFEVHVQRLLNVDSRFALIGPSGEAKGPLHSPSLESSAPGGHLMVPIKVTGAQTCEEFFNLY